MGPKKEAKKGAKEGSANINFNIDDPLNTDTWNCVVLMAVEKTQFDSFIVKEFLKESKNKRRQEVGVIDFNTMVMDVLNQFASGEVSYKYLFLLNYSSVFQEAVSYITQKVEVPVNVLVKVVKALLFYLKDESLSNIQKLAAGAPDPIKAMGEKETKVASVDPKKKEVSKKGDTGFKLKPPSGSKEDTKLLKRGEGTKFNQRIDDAPSYGFFNFYVLLTGFYKPDFLLELIKAEIPLHGLICIDTSNLGVKQESQSLPMFQRQGSDAKSEISNFWKDFLKMLWDPETIFYFKNTIFQVYMPTKIQCNKIPRQEFIYRELSYLLYDMSDLKRQMTNYLDHLKLWDVTLRKMVLCEVPLWLDDLPGECVSVPVMLLYLIDALCEVEKVPSVKSLKTSQLEDSEECLSASEPCEENQLWCEELKESGDIHLLQACLKTKELDIKYELYDDSTNGSDCADSDFCHFPERDLGENLEAALLMSDGMFRSYWKMHPNSMEKTYKLDFCLYALFMTKVLCSYEKQKEPLPNVSCSGTKKSSNSEILENLSDRVRKPRFTITEGSRTVLRHSRFNEKKFSRDFFCPEKLKIVNSEKLKAYSALEFRSSPGLNIENVFFSDIFEDNKIKNPFESLRGFINDSLFLNTNDFDFFEFLSQAKLLQKERDHWDRYNCIDHAYSILSDSIFFVLHNRIDDQNVHREMFNTGLRTIVGFRDFYDYVMEDEAMWLKNQEELRDIAVFIDNKKLENDSFINICNSEFWLIDSLKYQYIGRSKKELVVAEEVQTAPSFAEKLDSKIKVDDFKELAPSEELEGYDISEMAVQFSGMKTVYYADDCDVTVQLTERLYGTQNLGVHVTTASNSLHLHSYVCPQPHILEPFTFHISYKNGIIIAFGHRFVDITEKEEEIVELKVPKVKRYSAESSDLTDAKQTSGTVKDSEFQYDMVASIPNGLSIRTVRKIVQPCYIKQQYLVKIEETAKLESSRLFLPNGNIVKMMTDGTVQILKIDTSIMTANLNNLVLDEFEKLNFEKFTYISGEGYDQVFEQGKVTSSSKLPIFQNSDLETRRLYFRRRDGTMYVLQNDGTICVQFKDGTRLSCSIFEKTDCKETERKSSNSKNDQTEKLKPELFTPSYASNKDIILNNDNNDFVFIGMEITAEHPDYATVVYNTITQKWKILLPYDSTITVEPNGCYFVQVDKQTDVRFEDEIVKMERFDPSRKPLSVFTADLSVFNKPEGGVYCQMKDTTEKIFTLNSDSNYTISLPEYFKLEESFETIHESEIIKSKSSKYLHNCTPALKNSNKLSRENKYFVVERNLTGLQLLHKDDIGKELMETETGSLVYTLNVPKTESRCFVLITPEKKKELKKWQIETILPNPKYEPNSSPKTTSSTYGVPPSWMHPFPKKKIKFVIPQSLSCRVFLETKKTDLSPNIGVIDNFNYEMEEITEKYTKVQPEEFHEFLEKVSNDDQDILKEMYAVAVESLINEKKKLKPVNPEKLQHYLEMSKYYVELREYHKNCIRYNKVPKYFDHPIGMSWLILNDLLFKLNYVDIQKKAEIQGMKKVTGSDEIPLSAVEEFSNEEIEYNMSISTDLSYSDLSFHSSLSAKTAPGLLQTEGICRCKIKGEKHQTSCPVIKICTKKQTFSEEELKDPETRICKFEEKDIEKIEEEDHGGERNMFWISLEDLMYLGLV